MPPSTKKRTKRIRGTDEDTTVLTAEDNTKFSTKKSRTSKGASRDIESNSDSDVATDSDESVNDEDIDIQFNSSLIPERSESGELIFDDFPNFRPNLTPEEIIRAGSFGGTYFRPIYSSVTKKCYTPEQAMKGLPKKWFAGIDVKKLLTSNTYDKKVNKYSAQCGQGLKEWEMSGWITPYDPYGWFQWYCRFYLGRRCPDDARQIHRGMGVMGENGRWRRFLANKCLQSGKSMQDALNDYSISPKVRQLLQHWGYSLTLDALKKAKKMSKI